MGILYIVPTPIGNLNDITQRAIKVLEECNIIAAEDTRRTKILLNHFNIKNNLVSYHKFNEKARVNHLINKIIEEDINIALVSDAGTPCISDPGYHIVKAARTAGIDVIGISGASAVTIALSVSGIDTSSFAFYGFLSSKNSELTKQLKEILNSNVKTFVLYESPKQK